MQTLNTASADTVQERCRAAEQKAEGVAKEATVSTALHPDELENLPLLKVTCVAKEEPWQKTWCDVSCQVKRIGVKASML